MAKSTIWKEMAIGSQSSKLSRVCINHSSDKMLFTGKFLRTAHRTGTKEQKGRCYEYQEKAHIYTPTRKLV